MLSGGVDSATALALATSAGAPSSALFVDYGQPAAKAEAAASVSLAEHYGVRHRAIACCGMRFGAGEIRGRNAMLIHLALVDSEPGVGVVIIGIHAGTNYRDCSPDFLTLMESSYAFHTGGSLTVSAPFLAASKAEVIALAHELNVPIPITYSCESGNVPCNECASCLDRNAYDAGP